eukprot:scpid95610/ scgid35710/ 
MEKLSASPCFAIMIDETTYVFVLKQLAIVARCVLTSGDVCEMFFDFVDIKDDKAATITAALEQVIAKHPDELANAKFAAFGSDGAAVMTGRACGVATLLKQIRPHLITYGIGKLPK